MKTTDSYRGRQDRNASSRKTRVALLSAVSLAASLTGTALSADYTYTGPTWATWDNAGHWSPTGVPGNNDNAIVTAANGQFRAVTYTGNAFAPTLNMVIVNSEPGTGVPLLDHTMGNLSTNNTYVGSLRTGQYQQHNGVHLVNDSLQVGWIQGANGLYELSGGTLWTTNTRVGASGQGFFRQNAGHHIVGKLTLGASNVGTGTYLLHGGTLSTQQAIRVGDAGFGSFTMFGGRVTTPILQIANQAGSSAVFTQDAGFARVEVSDIVRIAAQQGSSGTYSLNFGTLLTNRMNVGEAGNGTMLVGGTVIAQSITVGTAPGGSGHMRISGGVNSQLITVGNGGNAIVEQYAGLSGGPLGSRLEIAPQAGTSGTYHLHGGTLSISALNLGSAGGNGLFNQTNGFASVGSINISGGSRYAKSGGTLNAGAMTNIGRFEMIGGGVATFGTVTNGAGTFVVGTGGHAFVNNLRQRQINLGDGTLSLRLRGEGGSVIRAERLDITGHPSGTGYLGAVDVGDGGLMLTAQTYQYTLDMLRKGRNNGAWDGNGITSRSARIYPRTALGLLTGQDYINAHGVNPAFIGHLVVPTDLLIVHTFHGDTDFDFDVDFDDYARTDAGFLNGGTKWFQGDFNYDHIVNFDDYALIDAAFLGQNNALTAAMQFLNGEDVDMNADPSLQMVQQHFARFGQPYANALTNAVPEPAAMAPLVALGGTFAARRRRRT